jgi:mono/diheme cytochrome c family protein
MTRVSIGLVALALLPTAIACGSPRRSEPLVGAQSLSQDERRGQVIFYRLCHQCHPYGEAGLGPAINSNPMPSFMKRQQVRRGLGAMPAFSDAILTDRELEMLMVYLDALEEHPEQSRSDRRASVVSWSRPTRASGH